MMSSLISAARVAMLLLLLLLGGAGGHIIMNTPTPYNFDMQQLLQAEPIRGGLSPFPCHDQYSFNTRTIVEAGAATLVNFTAGGGQLGGGSCQFSITYDEPAEAGDWNKSAAFKTIYSIIGGCPAANGIHQFTVPIPKFLKDGPATFAWTWFNELGNKEMYMSCAPINITSGTGDEEQIKDLPDIFIANYPNDPEIPNCITGTRADKIVVNFPHPGRFGRVLRVPTEPTTKPAGYCSQIPPPFSIPTFEPEYSQPTGVASVASFPTGHLPPAGRVTSATGSLPIPEPISVTTLSSPATVTATPTVTPFLQSRAEQAEADAQACCSHHSPTNKPPPVTFTKTNSEDTTLPPVTTTTAPIGRQPPPTVAHGVVVERADTSRHHPPTNKPPTVTFAKTTSEDVTLPPLATTTVPIGRQPTPMTTHRAITERAGSSRHHPPTIKAPTVTFAKTTSEDVTLPPVTSTTAPIGKQPAPTTTSRHMLREADVRVQASSSRHHPPSQRPPTTLLTKTVSEVVTLPTVATTSGPIGKQPAPTTTSRHVLREAGGGGGAQASPSRHPPSRKPVPTTFTKTVSEDVTLPPVATTTAPIGRQPPPKTQARDE